MRILAIQQQPSQYTNFGERKEYSLTDAIRARKPVSDAIVHGGDFTSIETLRLGNNVTLLEGFNLPNLGIEAGDNFRFEPGKGSLYLVVRDAKFGNDAFINGKISAKHGSIIALDNFRATRDVQALHQDRQIVLGDNAVVKGDVIAEDVKIGNNARVDNVLARASIELGDDAKVRQRIDAKGSSGCYSHVTVTDRLKARVVKANQVGLGQDAQIDAIYGNRVHVADGLIADCITASDSLRLGAIKRLVSIYMPENSGIGMSSGPRYLEVESEKIRPRSIQVLYYWLGSFKAKIPDVVKERFKINFVR